MDSTNMSLEQAQDKIRQLEEIQKRRYRTMSIPIRREITDWFTVVVPADLTAEDLQEVINKIGKAAELLIVEK